MTSRILTGTPYTSMPEAKIGVEEDIVPLPIPVLVLLLVSIPISIQMTLPIPVPAPLPVSGPVLVPVTNTNTASPYNRHTWKAKMTQFRRQ